MRTQFSSNRRGFSLLELLTVILIIGIVSVFVTPAVTTVMKGSQISQGEQIMTDQFKIGRQLALTKNRSVEVRFIRYGDPEVPGEQANSPSTGSYRAIQLFEVMDSGAILPIDKPQVLPPGTVFSDTTLSTLIQSGKAGTPGVNDPKMPRGIDLAYDFKSFRFLRDGSTDLKITGGVIWCITLVNMNDKVKGTLPPNFVTLQIDPAAGAIRIFRPSV